MILIIIIILSVILIYDNNDSNNDITVNNGIKILLKVNHKIPCLH